MAAAAIERDLEDICMQLRSRHGCRVVVLYGSHARGDATPGSDYDVAGFAPVAAPLRDARRWRGAFLDVFIYPEARLESPDAEMLKLRGGRVLFEIDAAGTRFLQRLEHYFDAGPERLPEDEIQARRAWAYKMLDRIRRGDLEGRYRRAWLLTALLEDYFQLRQSWFPGPKEGFEWLRNNDAPTLAAFERALEPQANMESIATLVAAVAGPEPGAPG